MFWKLLTAFIDGEACDPAEYGRVYTEGEPMPPEERTTDPDDATAEDYEAALARLGVSV